MSKDRIVQIRDGLKWGLSTNLELDDETLEYNLLEQFEPFLWSDLYPDNLRPLVDSGLFSEEEYKLSQQLRNAWLKVIDQDRSATEIRRPGSPWREALVYADQLWTKLENRLEASKEERGG